MSEAHGTKAVVAALLANLAIAAGKFVGFLLTGASSMLAESAHSVADSGNQGLLLLGGKWSQRVPTPKHPFGYGRERYFWAFVVALVLFSLGSVFSLFEGFEKMRHPHEITDPLVAVAILLLAIGVESWSFRIAITQSNMLRAGRSWAAFIRRAKVPELPVVLLEDAGATVGLLLALVGVGLSSATGDSRFDAYATLAIGALLGVIAAVLAVEMRSLLLGEAASPEDVLAIQAAIEAGPEVRNLLHLQTQHLGPEELLVAAKLELVPDLSFGEVVQAIDAAERRVRDSVPIARVMYLEPDLAPSPDGTDG